MVLYSPAQRNRKVLRAERQILLHWNPKQLTMDEATDHPIKNRKKVWWKSFQVNQGMKEQKTGGWMLRKQIIDILGMGEQVQIIQEIKRLDHLIQKQWIMTDHDKGPKLRMTDKIAEQNKVTGWKDHMQEDSLWGLRQVKCFSWSWDFFCTTILNVQVGIWYMCTE